MYAIVYEGLSGILYKSLVKGYEAVRGLFGGGGALRASSLWARVELSSSSPPNHDLMC